MPKEETYSTTTPTQQPPCPASIYPREWRGGRKMWLQKSEKSNSGSHTPSTHGNTPVSACPSQRGVVVKMTWHEVVEITWPEMGGPSPPMLTGRHHHIPHTTCQLQRFHNTFHSVRCCGTDRKRPAARSSRQMFGFPYAIHFSQSTMCVWRKERAYSTQTSPLGQGIMTHYGKKTHHWPVFVNPL